MTPDAAAPGIVTCAGELDRACDEMLCSESAAISALALALGRRVARAVPTLDCLGRAVAVAAYSVGTYAAIEGARLKARQIINSVESK